MLEGPLIRRGDILSVNTNTRPDVEIVADPPLAPVLALVREGDLVHEDLTTALMAHFFGARADGQWVGVCGLEITGETGLLRSLVVAPAWRSRNIASRLVAATEAHARALGLTQLHLLTEHADRVFERLGYVRVDRDVASPALRATRQFAALCPASAVLMRKTLSRPSTGRHP